MLLTHSSWVKTFFIKWGSNRLATRCKFLMQNFLRKMTKMLFSFKCGCLMKFFEDQLPKSWKNAQLKITLDLIFLNVCLFCFIFILLLQENDDCTVIYFWWFLTCLGVADFQAFRSYFDFTVNLLLVWSHQAEIIVVKAIKHLIQGCNSVICRG